IFRLDHQRRRRLPPNTLQRCQYFHDDGAAFVERRLEYTLALVQRLQPRLRCVDAGFDVAATRGGIDKLLIERGAIGANRLDLLLQLSLFLYRHPLLGARCIEFLIMLLERIQARLCRVWRRGSRLRRWNLRRWNLDRRRWPDRTLREGGGVGSERQHESQCRTEHKARVGAARPSENHRVQG